MSVLRCVHCGATQIWEHEKGAETYGWRPVHDGHACSESCAASHAIDITPPETARLPDLTPDSPPA